jgi:molecular chaperone GrpE
MVGAVARGRRWLTLQPFFRQSAMNTHPEQDPSGPRDEPEGMGDEQGTAPSETERLAAELAFAEAQLQESRDAQLRAFAEMENVRKRAQRDVEAAHRFAVERFAADIVEVRDTLELGIAASTTAADSAAMLEGMSATLRMIDKAFEKAGIAVVDPAGEAFNPEFHEAMVTQPSAEHEPGTIMHVVQKGFTLSGRLIRPARVIIARAPD